MGGRGTLLRIPQINMHKVIKSTALAPFWEFEKGPGRELGLHFPESVRDSPTRGWGHLYHHMGTLQEEAIADIKSKIGFLVLFTPFK